MSKTNPNRVKVICCPPYGCNFANASKYPMRSGEVEFSRRALREEMAEIAFRKRRAAYAVTTAPVWLVGGADVIVLPTVSFFRELCKDLDGDRLRLQTDWYIQAKSSSTSSARLIVYVNSIHELNEAMSHHLLGMVQIVTDLLIAEEAK